VAALPIYSGADLTAEFWDGLKALEEASQKLPTVVSPPDLVAVEAALRRLRIAGESGQVSMLLATDTALMSRVRATVERLWDWLGPDPAADAAAGDRGLDVTGQEAVRQLSDAIWALEKDYLDVVSDTVALATAVTDVTALLSWMAVARVLRAIDRLEVRGRDSAGVAILVSLKPGQPLQVPVERDDPLFRNRSCVRTRTGLGFVYKRASVVGRLGDNIRGIRESIQADELLREALSRPDTQVAVVAHTRWASVGRISEPNAHPVNSLTEADESTEPLAMAVLNGDIDNYLNLPLVEGAVADSETGITTDAKVIPVGLVRLMRRQSGDGVEAIRQLVDLFEGSMAMVAWVDANPDDLLLAVKGSGQSLYVGLSPTVVFVASEAYGIVEVTDRFLHVDGALIEASGEIGTFVHLRRAGATVTIERLDPNGRRLPYPETAWLLAEVTTRDLDLQGFDHYLHKEIAQSSLSFTKTLRGRITETAGQLAVSLPEGSLPKRLRELINHGSINRVVVMGQGTAAIAAQGVAHVMNEIHGSKLPARALLATELSARHLKPSMADTLIVPISQSGSTTDTNRATDLAKERGAFVVSIVNRRNSDLESKSDAVIHTSDGRDIEMAVASTKAFYSQAAAGCLLALDLGHLTGSITATATDQYLVALRRIPDQLDLIGSQHQRIAELAGELAPRSRYWSVVGSGSGLVAAAEIRIKLSELCYRTVSLDAIEDKKHIDLSAEALTLACVAGASPAELSDLSKEIAILKAHANTPLVICDSGTEALWRGANSLGVPRTMASLAWILVTAVGHLFAYYAAKAIDAEAGSLRDSLLALNNWAEDHRLESLRSAREAIGRFLKNAEYGQLRGVLSADHALQMVAAGQRLDDCLGPVGEDHRDEAMVAVESSLRAVIDDLTRPVDTVRHQAKTVTVGTSRSDSGIYDNHLAEQLLAYGVDLVALGIGVSRSVEAFSRVVATIDGLTEYRVFAGRIQVVRKVGQAQTIPSRADAAPISMVGSKRRSVETDSGLLVRGVSDGRLVLILPVLDRTGGSAEARVFVAHVALKHQVSSEDLVVALRHLDDRWTRLREIVSELVPSFTEANLAALPVETVLFGHLEDVAAGLAKA